MRILLMIFALSFSSAYSRLAAQDLTWTTDHIQTMPCADAIGYRKFQSDSSYSMDNAILMLWSVYRAESGDVEGFSDELNNLGFNKISVIRQDPKGAQVFIASNDQNVLIVFRGSVSIKEVLRDAIFGQAKSRIKHISGRLHLGMQIHFNEMIGEIMSELANHDPHKHKTLFLSGHSLGAAMAILAAAYTQAENYHIRSVYTSAQPRIGDSEFFRQIEVRLGSRLYGLVLANDLIPQLPPSKWTASEFANLIPQGDSMKVKLEDFVKKLNYDISPGQITSFSGNHFPKRYDSNELDEYEKRFWQQLASTVHTSNFFDIIKELQERFGSHNPASYLCQVGSALAESK